MPHKPLEGETVDKEKEAEKMFQHEVCIATDDPRLKEK
jgi:hypothetical protein